MKGRSLELVRLKGILAGIGTDSMVNEKELLFLDAWLREREAQLEGDGDVVDLLEQIADVLEDGVITQDEMDDTLNLIDCILEYQENPPHSTNLQEVFGFIQGVVADNVIEEPELKAIHELLERNDDVPMCALLSAKINNGLSHEQLIQALKSFSGHYLEETGSTQDWSSFLGDELPSDYDFRGKKICFTGGVTGMPRSALKSHVAKLGATVTKSVTQLTDFLVVGDECSRGWIEHNYGTKLDTACKLKLKGHGIMIISGEEWLSKTANQKDPQSEARSSIWSKFGDHMDLDSIAKATERLCEQANLSVSQYHESEFGYFGVSIHRKWKNGNPMKKRELFIEFVPHTINQHSGESEVRTKPWVVGGDDKQSIAYQHQTTAFEKYRESFAHVVTSHMDKK